MEIEDIETRFIKEILEAEKQFPGWPMDVIHAAGIVAEERGELMKAAINFHYGRGTREEMLKEATQVGAMAMRFLINLEDYRPEADKPEVNFLRKKDTTQPETCDECVHFEASHEFGGPENYCPFKECNTEADSKGCGEGERK